MVYPNFQSLLQPASLQPGPGRAWFEANGLLVVQVSTIFPLIFMASMHDLQNLITQKYVYIV